MKFRKSFVALVAAALLALAAPAQAVTVLLDDNFDARVASGVYTLDADWVDGNTYGPWYANFLGFGTTEVKNSSNSRLSMTPADVDVTGQPTHAALVTTTASYSPGANGVELEARLRTLNQLRNTSPNAWETGWVYFMGSNDASGDYQGYYVALKTNGFELGKSVDGYAGRQRFLVTLATPTSSSSYQAVNFKIKNIAGGVSIEVWVGGVGIDLNGAAAGKAFNDTGGPNGDAAFTSGNAGLYTEDAEVEFEDIKVRQF